MEVLLERNTLHRLTQRMVTQRRILQVSKTFFLPLRGEKIREFSGPLENLKTLTFLEKRVSTDVNALAFSPPVLKKSQFKGFLGFIFRGKIAVRSLACYL